jgi:hypothetical protein
MFSASYCTKIRDILIHSCLIFAFRDEFPVREFLGPGVRTAGTGYFGSGFGRFGAGRGGVGFGLHGVVIAGKSRAGMSAREMGTGRGLEWGLGGDYNGDRAGSGMRIGRPETCAAENNKIMAKPFDGELVRCLQKRAARAGKRGSEIGLTNL